MSANVWTRNRQERGHFGLDARSEAALIRISQEKGGEIEPEDVQLGLATEGPNRRWYERVAGRMSVDQYTVVLSYATGVILLGWWPWNVLLILLLFPSWGSRRGGSL